MGKKKRARKKLLEELLGPEGKIVGTTVAVTDPRRWDNLVDFQQLAHGLRLHWKEHKKPEECLWCELALARRSPLEMRTYLEKLRTVTSTSLLDLKTGELQAK